MKNILVILLFTGISAFTLICISVSAEDYIDCPTNESSDTIIVNFEYGEDFSDSKWKNIYVIWMEDTTSGFLQNIFICQKLITGGVTGTALPFWKMNKYPLSSSDEIDAITSATQANTDFSVSAILKDSKIRNFDLYFEVDRSYEPNDWFSDQPALLYSVNVNLDDSTSEYELTPIGWTPNESTQNKIPNTPIGQLQKEMKYITHHKAGSSFGDNDERSSTRMVKKLTASIKSSIPTNLVPAISNDFSISIFPNPATKEINIKSKDIISEVLITTIQGHTIFHIYPNTFESKFILTRNIAPGGTYFAKIKTSKGIVIRKILITD